MSDVGKAEQNFLHDISGSLGNAIFLTDMILDNIRSRQPSETNLEDINHVEQVYSALEQMKKAIHERRQVLLG